MKPSYALEMELLEREHSLSDLTLWLEGAVGGGGCIALVSGEADAALDAQRTAQILLNAEFASTDESRAATNTSQRKAARRSAVKRPPSRRSQPD